MATVSYQIEKQNLLMKLLTYTAYATTGHRFEKNQQLVP